MPSVLRHALVPALTALALLAGCDSDATGADQALGHFAMRQVNGQPHPSGGDLLLDTDGSHYFAVTAFFAERGRWRRVPGSGGTRLVLSRVRDPRILDGDTNSRLVSLRGDSATLRYVAPSVADTIVVTFTRRATAEPALPDGRWVLVSRNGRPVPRTDTTTSVVDIGTPRSTRRLVVSVAFDTFEVRGGVIARRSFSRSSILQDLDDPRIVFSSSAEVRDAFTRIVFVRPDSIVLNRYRQDLGFGGGEPLEAYRIRGGGDTLVRELFENVSATEVFRRIR